VLLAVITASVIGCAPLTRNEEAQYAEILHDGIIAEPVQKKKTWAAGTLNFLVPGVGHFYLGEWGSGTGLFLSNLLWPLSPFWAAPAAFTATDNVNKRYTIEYFTLGEGKEIIARRKSEKCFENANEYIGLQVQNGKNDLTANEISQYLFLQGCTPETIKGIDWQALQTRGGISFKTVYNQVGSEPIQRSLE
jgi:hypothetical protein